MHTHPKVSSFNFINFINFFNSRNLNSIVLLFISSYYYE